MAAEEEEAMNRLLQMLSVFLVETDNMEWTEELIAERSYLDTTIKNAHTDTSHALRMMREAVGAKTEADAKVELANVELANAKVELAKVEAAMNAGVGDDTELSAGGRRKSKKRKSKKSKKSKNKSKKRSKKR